MRFYIRQSQHIQDDIKRGWSSWNFGQDGIAASEEEFEKALETCIEQQMPLPISGFEIWPDEFETSAFGQLYPGYWVLIDQNQGLCCSSFEAENEQDAISKINANLIDFAAGESLPTEAKLVASVGDLHLFM
jgi:hypothetical protein